MQDSIIAIENKILSGENLGSKGLQLKKYRDELDRQEEENLIKKGVLVYLTIDSHGKSKSRKEDIHISYLTEICDWLIECLKRARSPRVQHTLEQYMESVQDLRVLSRKVNDANE
jgi:hypothetical protein